MAGIVMGNYSGFSLATNAAMTYRKLLMNIQTQYTLNSTAAKEHFFFNWTEIAVQSCSWFYAGVSMQQLKPYRSKWKAEYGMLTGFVFKKFSVPVYVFNPLGAGRNCIVGISTEW